MKISKGVQGRENKGSTKKIMQSQQKYMSCMHQRINIKPTKRYNNKYKQFETRETNAHGLLFFK